MRNLPLEDAEKDVLASTREFEAAVNLLRDKIDATTEPVAAFFRNLKQLDGMTLATWGSVFFIGGAMGFLLGRLWERNPHKLAP